MSARSFVPVVGLIGGVGSGKSRLANWASHQRNILVIDGDKIGHEILQDAAVRQRIRSRFGDAVFQADGQVDRGSLGREVFGDDSRKREARHDLESIVHPAIRNSIAERITRARSETRPAEKVESVTVEPAAKGPKSQEARHSEKTAGGGPLAAILLDAAVLLEAGWDDLCDFIVFVDVPRESRLARVTRGRGWSESQFESRESSQHDIETKRGAADLCVDNSGPVEHAGNQLLQFLDEITNTHFKT